MRLWDEKPMPVWEQWSTGLVVAALWAIGLVANVGHVHTQAEQVHWLTHAPFFLATMSIAPDILLYLCVTNLRYRPKSILGWLGVAGGVAWLAEAAYAEANNSLERWYSLIPIALAVYGTLQLHLPSKPEPVVVEVPVEKPRRVRKPVIDPVTTSAPVEVPAVGTAPVPEVPVDDPVLEPAAEARAATDEELVAIARPIVEAGGGAPKVKVALEQAGLKCSSERRAKVVAQLKEELAGNVVQLNARAAAQ